MGDGARGGLDASVATVFDRRCLRGVSALGIADMFGGVPLRFTWAAAFAPMAPLTGFNIGGCGYMCRVMVY